MSTTLSLTETEQNRILDNLSDQMDGGQLNVYAGTVPTDADTALSGETLLAEVPLDATASGAAADGSITMNGVTPDGNNNAGGTATYYRVFNSTGQTQSDCILQGTIGTTGSGESMILADVNLVQNGTFDIDSWTISF